MFRSFLSILFVFISINNLRSQSDLDQFKYFIVPTYFNGFDSADKYQLNSLTYFLFKKNNFEVLKETDSKPSDLSKSPCLGGLLRLVKHKGGIFKTKVSFDIIDCNNQVVFKSDIGESREKDFKTAYHEALRNTFECINNEDYGYSSKINSVQNSETTTDAIDVNIQDEIYYAQKIPNGYQLVDTKPSVFCKMFETDTENVYLVEGKSAMIKKENGNWVYSYLNKDGIAEKRTIIIKF